MSGETAESEMPPVTDGVENVPITGRGILVAMVGGFVGTALMLPILVGVPRLLDLFQTDPVTRFAGIGLFFGVEPTVTLGVLLFGVGGTFVLPVMFLVVGAFLPPETPRFLRGVTFATIMWVGFAPAFWPQADALVVGTYLVVSLVGHWVYGATLGEVLDRTIGIPQHEV